MTEQKSPHHIKFVGPIFLIGVGVILLLNNLGYLNWNFWDIARLWPVLLIAAGLETLVGRHSTLGSLIAAGIVLLMLVGGVWFIGFAPAARETGVTQTIREPLNDFSAALVKLNPGVGRLVITALDDSTDFVAGEIVTNRREKLERAFHFTAGQAEFTLRSEQAWFPAFLSSEETRLWSLGFHPNVTLNLQAGMGAGEITLDLSALSTEAVSVEFGLGHVEITLPDGEALHVTVAGAIGEIIINVPVGANLYIEAETGMVERQFPSNYTQNDNSYQSFGYNAAANPMRLDVGLAFGQVILREYWEVE